MLFTKYSNIIFGMASISIDIYYQKERENIKKIMSSFVIKKYYFKMNKKVKVTDFKFKCPYNMFAKFQI